MNITAPPIRIPTQPIGALNDNWRRCVGTGRAREVLHWDYRDALEMAQDEIGFLSTRCHGIFHDDMGLYRPYSIGPYTGVRYGFQYVDQVIDTWLSSGMQPFLELGFMPKEMASGEQTVFWWEANVTPPRDYREWADLVTAFMKHLIDRYGIDEVRSWPVEVWNEPNLDIFWEEANEQEYYRLYDVTSRAVKAVDSQIQVGGPAISPGHDYWLPNFADYIASSGAPCDFVSKHAYTSSPSEDVPFGVYQGFKPPEDLLTQFATPRTLLAGTVLENLPVHITEFSSSYHPLNPIHDTAYQAAYLAPVVARGGDLVDSFSYWTLSDVFEEQGIPTTPLHGGFGLVATRNLRKPAYHLYHFMAAMGPELLQSGDNSLVSRHDDGSISALLWQTVDGATPNSEGTEITLEVPTSTALFVIERHVDERRGNVRSAWLDMGSPLAPDFGALSELEAASAPHVYTRRVEPVDGTATITVNLGIHGIALAEIRGAESEQPQWQDDSRILGENPGA